MKMREQHVVPLSKHALALLRELQVRTGSGALRVPLHSQPIKADE
jgi:hypothetical protein